MKTLFAPEIAFGSLDGYVPKKKLNLFKLASSLMAEPGAGSTKIVWSDHTDSATFGRFANYGPNYLRRESATLNSSSLTYGAEERSIP